MTTPHPAGHDGPTSDDLLGLSQIARRLGIGPSVISNWKTRYPTEFPAPRSGTSGRPLYSFSEVRAWIEQVPGRAALVRAAAPGADADDAEVLSTVNRLREELRADVPVRDVPSVVALAAALVHIGRDRLEVPNDGWEAAGIARLISDASINDPWLFHLAARVSASISCPLDELVARAVRIISGIDDLAALLDHVLEPGAVRRGADAEHRSAVEEALSSMIRSVAPRRVSSAADLASGLATVLAEAVGDERAGKVELHDIDDEIVQLAAVRMLLRGIPVDAIAGDSLGGDPPRRHELVVAEPVIGVRPSKAAAAADGTSRYPWGTIGLASADMAWLQTAALSTAPGGVGLVVTAATALADAATKDARRALVADGTLRAVVTVPSPHPRTGAVTDLAIWVVGADAATCGLPSDAVLLMHARTEDELTTVLERFRALWGGAPSIGSDGSSAAVVSRSDLLESGSRLYPWRWTEPPVSSLQAQAGLDRELGGATLRLRGPRPEPLSPLEIDAPDALLTVRDLLLTDLERPLPVPRAELLRDSPAQAASTWADVVATAKNAATGPLRLMLVGSLDLDDRASTLGLIRPEAGDIVLEVVDDAIVGSLVGPLARSGAYVQKSSSRAVLRLTKTGRERWVPEYLLACLTAPAAARMLPARDSRGRRGLEELELVVPSRSIEYQRRIVESVSALQELEADAERAARRAAAARLDLADRLLQP